MASRRCGLGRIRVTSWCRASPSTLRLTRWSGSDMSAVSLSYRAFACGQRLFTALAVHRCHLAVVTSIFGGYDQLHPYSQRFRAELSRIELTEMGLRSCWFAFTDSMGSPRWSRRAGGPPEPRLLSQTGRVRCIAGVTYGGDETRVWVSSGCRGIFRVQEKLVECGDWRRRMNTTCAVVAAPAPSSGCHTLAYGQWTVVALPDSALPHPPSDPYAAVLNACVRCKADRSIFRALAVNRC